MSPTVQKKDQKPELTKVEPRRQMTNNYPSTRKQAVRLTEDEQYAVYKYCIENHCVYQIEAAIEFRVEPSKIANEINTHYPKIANGKKMNPYHVKTSVEEVVAWQKRIGKLPVTPIETAELEQLRIYKNKTMKEIEELKLQFTMIDNHNKSLKAEIERLNKSGAQAVLERVRQIVNGSTAASLAPKQG